MACLAEFRPVAAPGSPARPNPPSLPPEDHFTGALRGHGAHVRQGAAPRSGAHASSSTIAISDIFSVLDRPCGIFSPTSARRYIFVVFITTDDDAAGHPGVRQHGHQFRSNRLPGPAARRNGSSDSITRRCWLTLRSGMRKYRRYSHTIRARV